MTMPTKTLPGRLVIRALLLAGLLSAGEAVGDSGRLVVELQNIRDNTGQIRASLYRDPDSFRKEVRALQVVSLPAQAGTLTLNFDGLSPGRYAVMAYHDSNEDQKLNLRLGMIPIEGYGLSNNPRVMGPPKFDDSAFELASPESRIAIRLAY